MTVREQRGMERLVTVLAGWCCCICCVFGQGTLQGLVSDASSGETLIGASIVEKGTTNGVVTDFNGAFSLDLKSSPPVTIIVSFVGYTKREVLVQDLSKKLKVKLSTDAVVLKQAEVIGSRISDKQKQAALTVESMDVIAVKEAPSGDFYESLGTLKGVDMTAASMGFKVINTRGFNSTSPVRSLQLIDGVDNQSPGLNFSLGNFLGASDLDVMKVDIVAGASSAFYGPGAFNGVINMKTKSPWLFPGTSAFIKAGERNQLVVAARHAQVFKTKDGTKDRWAYKINAYGMSANDWVAENYSPTIDSPTDELNPGGYDAVNIYGDEEVVFNNDFTGTISERNDFPGLGRFLRNGYKETDLVDYDAENFKLGASFHYLLDDSLEMIASSNFSTGSTVYQGDNRYRLEGVQFFQHKLEVGRWDDWFVRAYVTHEDAGQTYDIYTTALRLQEQTGTTQDWNIQYFNLWRSWIEAQVESRPDYITAGNLPPGWDGDTWIAWQDQYIADNADDFSAFHQMVRDSVNNLETVFLSPFLEPGTAEFDEAVAEITSRKFTDNGSLFFDRSALGHVMGEKKFETKAGKLTVGSNYRQYRPNTQGTIFRDTGNVVIRNWEVGGFAGLERKMAKEKLTGTFTVRVDKNQNFNALVSPAASLVYKTDSGSVWRLSVSSAIRNPTLADQYLFYNVGRAILLGNISGQFEEGSDSLMTISSFNDYRNDPNGLVSGLSNLDYFNVDRIRPEQVRTVEMGYRGNPWKRHYIDVSAYHSWYKDFIGYLIGISSQFDQTTGFPIGGLNVYRISANAVSTVRTQGFNFGWNYYRKRATYSGNYSWNKLVTGDDDPIVPAFNTPQHKFNLGVTGHEYLIPWTTSKNLGFGVNYKFVQGFTFEGSPQFTGDIPSYDMVDAQVSMGIPTKNLTVKLGVSNLFGIYPFFDPDIAGEDRLNRALNNDVYLVFGGPRVGRLGYLQLTYELNKRQ